MNFTDFSQVMSVGKIDDNSIVNGDCLAVMKYIPDAIIDTIICDLPYGTTNNKWDSIIDINLLWSEYRRIIKNNGVIVLFGHQPFTTAITYPAMDLYREHVIWDKVLVSDFLNSKKRHLNYHDDIIIFSKSKLGNYTYNPQMRIGDSYNIMCKGNTTASYGNFNPIAHESNLYFPKSIVKFSNKRTGLHQTSKPVDLLEYLVLTYSNEGDMILDNAMGSGSTIKACINKNRKFIGIELDKEIYDRTRSKLEETNVSSSKCVRQVSKLPEAILLPFQ